ncbi:amidase [Glaciecola sp. 1036]|uniref:amidase n=1 Tax=Alteromonadaceae TaxID=72275 RepID=UPI003D0285F0
MSVKISDPFVTREFSPQLQAIRAQSSTLSGLRLAVKDLFHIAGLPTTAGNPDWQKTHTIPTTTSSAVEKLILNGADYVGKTITDEIAYSLNGQNIHYGTPTNPVTPDRLPGGSSSGSATAVSSNQADIGLGTDTGGSIRVPASYNGLFGLRPTINSISMDNMVPLAPGFDTVGWMTKSLSQLSQVANVMFEHQIAQKVDGKIAVAKNLLALAEHQSAIQESIEGIANASDVTFSNITIDVEGYNISETFRILQGAEIWQQHGEWITQCKPQFAPDIQQRLDWCKSIEPEQIESAKSAQIRFQQKLNELMQNVDCILLPTTPGYSPLLSSSAENLAKYRNHLMNLTAIAGLTGRPQLHIPLSNTEFPCGFSLLGKVSEDLTLIDIAKSILEFIPYAKND